MHSLVVLYMVAGFRGLNALSDTEAYYSTYRFETQNYSFTDYLNYTKTHDTLYYMTNWLFARAGVPWQLYLTMVSLFVIGSFVYWIYCKYCEIWLSPGPEELYGYQFYDSGWQIYPAVS